MDARSTKAGQVLNHLAASLNEMVRLLEQTIHIIRPPSAHTLPTVTATLSGVVQAAENAALQVLDEAEALGGDTRELNAALDKLRARHGADSETVGVLDEASRCSSALSDRSMRLIAAMEFQDLASQHIGRVVESIEDVRNRLTSALALFDLPEGELPPAPAAAGAAAIGDPTRSHGGGQALADQLLAELR